MKNDRFKDYDDEVRDNVLEFENTVLKGDNQFFDVDQLEIIIDYYLETADLDNLEAAVRYAEHLYPDNNEIRLRRSHLYSARNQFDKALAILRQLERVEPDNTDIDYALGAVYSMMDRPDLAIKYYSRASADGYELGMVNGNIADEYYKLGRFDESIRYYKKSIAASPDDERSLLNLLDTYAEQGQADKSVEYFKKFVTREPYSKYGWYCLGEAYCDLGLYELAIDAFEYAVAIDRTMYDAYLGMADCYEAAGQTAKAVESLRRAFDYAPQKEEIHFDIALVYMRAGNYDTAMIYLKKAEQTLRSNPDVAPYFVADLYASLADCYRAQGEYYLAVQSAAAALSVTTDPGRILRFLGQTHEEYGDSEKADISYRGAIEHEPDNDDNWLAYIDFLLRAGRYDDAGKQLLQAAAATDDLYPYNLRYAVLYFRTGRRNFMFAVITQCIAADPDAGRHLADLCPDLAADPDVAAFIMPDNNRD